MKRRAMLLEHERRKLQWLRGKLRQQEQRVAALEGLADDPLDEMFERETGPDSSGMAHKANETFHPDTARFNDADDKGNDDLSLAANTMFPSITTAAVQDRPIRPVSDNWAQVLQFIGTKGAALTDVYEFVKKIGSPLTQDTLRGGLMNYRKQLGYIANPRRGFYVLTSRGLEALRSQTSNADLGGALASSGVEPAAEAEVH